jgi:hypothetical protein
MHIPQVSDHSSRVLAMYVHLQWCVFAIRYGRVSWYCSHCSALLRIPVISQILAGTVFAFGKTHTMMGTKKNPGVVLESVQDIFIFIEQESDALIYAIASFCSIIHRNRRVSHLSVIYWNLQRQWERFIVCQRQKQEKSWSLGRQSGCLVYWFLFEIFPS